MHTIDFWRLCVMVTIGFCFWFCFCFWFWFCFCFWFCFWFWFCFCFCCFFFFLFFLCCCKNGKLRTVTDNENARIFVETYKTYSCVSGGNSCTRCVFSCTRGGNSYHSNKMVRKSCKIVACGKKNQNVEDRSKFSCEVRIFLQLRCKNFLQEKKTFLPLKYGSACFENLLATMEEKFFQ